MTERTDSSVDGDALAGGDRTTATRVHVTETLARIGASIGAQRAELYQREDDHVRLVGWWAALHHLVVPPNLSAVVPSDWFPWTLGNIQRAGHVFVRNAATLPLRPGAATITIGELGMGSALYLPLHDGIVPIGAVCAYWAQERDDWDATSVEHLADLGREALMPRP